MGVIFLDVKLPQREANAKVKVNFGFPMCLHGILLVLLKVFTVTEATFDIKPL